MDIKTFSRAYFELLNGDEFKGLNLTAIRDEQDFLDKQVLDSLAPFSQIQYLIDEMKKIPQIPIVDVGFGGGFPLLPLAWQFPSHRFLGIESKAKKVEAVRKIAHKLSLKNIDFLHSRVEDVLFDQKCFITFKAVGKVQDFLRRITTTSNDVRVFFYKGKNFFTMLEEETGSIGANWKLIENWEVTVPGTEGRFLVGYQSNVPRRTSDKKERISTYLSGK